MTDNNHRFTLTRKWIGSGGRINWIMLNPSTADEVQDDPTIRKVIGFSKRWGFSELVVTNLFAFRATKPAALWKVHESDYVRALGTRADEAIEEAAKSSRLVVAAWGAHKKASARAEAVMNLVIHGIDLYCIGLTQGGFPLHPCMAAYTDAPVLFTGRDS